MPRARCAVWEQFVASDPGLAVQARDACFKCAENRLYIPSGAKVSFGMVLSTEARSYLTYPQVNYFIDKINHAKTHFCAKRRCQASNFSVSD